MPNPTDEESSQNEDYLLAEVTRDELELINQHRAIYSKVKHGETFSLQPRQFTSRIETEDEVTEVKYHPLTVKTNNYSKNRSKYKISHGKVSDGKNNLEIASYTNSNRIGFIVFLNGERLYCQIDEWRKFFRMFNRVGHYLGILGQKKRKKRRKK